VSAAHPGLERWHAYITSGGDLAQLADMLAEDAVFHSPVVHTPQTGKAKVMAYLGAASQTLGNSSFRYARELVDGDCACLEFITEMDGIIVNGIDLITWNPDGKITDFKVMVRPLKAVNKVWEAMAAQLQAANA
jgi:ketosteroid isomerase-like protein